MKDRCVLVVDDETAITQFCARVLRSADCEVLVASRVDEAIGILSEAPYPHFVLTDVQMSGKDGWVLARWMRKNRPEVPVGMMTGNAFPDFQQQVQNVGAVGFLAKPFTSSQLEKFIKSVVA